MPHLLSTKLDATLRFAGGLYGVATSVLTDIATALSNVAAVAATLTAHLGSGGTAHATATGSTAGFMTAANAVKLATLAAGSACTLGRVQADAFSAPPTTFAYAASYQIDPSVKNDYAGAALTGNITFTFANHVSGHQGMIAVRQDTTGGRTVTITPPAGWTLMRDNATANLAAAGGANAITVYTYAFVTVGALNLLFVGKLTPVAA